MKTIYLHIGPHKTGTTFLQKIFHENQDNFLSKESIAYPNGYKIIFGHHELVTQLKNGKYSAIEMVNIIESTNADKIFFSSENFDLLNESEIEVLIASFKAYEVKIVAMFREPSIRLYSWWQEEVKHGSFRTFSEYALHHLSRPMVSDIFNLDVVLSRYNKFVVDENILVGNYDAFMSHNGIEDFFESLLNIKFPNEKNISVNSGLIGFDVEMIRLMNSMYKKKKRKPAGSMVRDYYLQNKKTFEREKIDKIEACYTSSLTSYELGDLYQDRVVRQSFFKKYKVKSPVEFDESVLNTFKKLPGNDWYLTDDVYEMVNELFCNFLETDGGVR